MFFVRVFRLITLICVCFVLYVPKLYSLEPYTVRTVYFMPTDSIDRSDWLDLNDIMKSNQNVYRNEMDRYGFPDKTFRLELDNEGKVIVHKIIGKGNKAFYRDDTLGLVTKELEARFNDKKNIYAIVIAGVPALQSGFAGGVASARPGGWWNKGEDHGFALSGETTRANTEQVLLHEIGHTFGLHHIVLYDAAEFILGSGKKLSLHEARWLSKSYYFNDEWNFGFAPSIVNFHDAEGLDNNDVRFRVDVSDPNGLHQAYAWLNTNIVGWDYLNGGNTDTAVFDIERRHVSNNNELWIQLMDNDGNWLWYRKHYRLPDKLPEPEPEEVIYKDYIKNGTQTWDFEEHAKGWKIANGNWSVDNGLYKVSRGGVAEHSLVGQSHWENYTIDAKVRIDDFHWSGVVFRAKSEMEYYVYYMNALDNRVELWKHNMGAWDNRQGIAWTFAVGGIHIKNNVWYNITIEVINDKFICYINGKKQLEQLDDSYVTGKVGVWAWNTAASFDDFTVTKKEIEEDMNNNLNVDPVEKLTTLWGHIKQR